MVLFPGFGGRYHVEIVNNGTNSALLATERLGNLTKEDLYYVRMVHVYSRSRSAPVVAT